MPQKLGFDLAGVASTLSTKLWMLQRTFNWQLILPSDIGGVFGVLVSQYCQDVKFGFYSISEVHSLRYGPYQRFYAGLMSIETVSLMFIMPVDNSVFEYFKSWRRLMVDDDGYYYPKKNYKKDVYIQTFDRSGIQSGEYILRGSFPKTLAPISLSYGEDNVLKWSVDLCVDRVEESSLIGSIKEGVTRLAGGVIEGARKILG